MTTVQPNLTRLRWAVRAVLALGVTASTAANILHAQDNPISQTIAAWPPLALLLTVELLSRVPVHRRSLGLVRLVAAAGIAGIAAWVSYWHMADVVARYGETGASPYLLPLSVDGLVVVASICLVELGGRIRSDRPVVRKPAPAVPSTPTAPSVEPVRHPVRVASPRPSRPQVDVATVRELSGGTLPRNRDELRELLRPTKLTISNARAGELMRELRTA